MRYTVTTFKVRLEVAESGIRMKDSKDAEIIARGILIGSMRTKNISW